MLATLRTKMSIRDSLVSHVADTESLQSARRLSQKIEETRNSLNTTIRWPGNCRGQFSCPKWPSHGHAERSWRSRFGIDVRNTSGTCGPSRGITTPRSASGSAGFGLVRWLGGRNAARPDAREWGHAAETRPLNMRSEMRGRR